MLDKSEISRIMNRCTARMNELIVDPVSNKAELLELKITYKCMQIMLRGK